jgi:hypothetical protein
MWVDKLQRRIRYLNKVRFHQGKGTVGILLNQGFYEIVLGEGSTKEEEQLCKSLYKCPYKLYRILKKLGAEEMVKKVTRRKPSSSVKRGTFRTTKRAKSNPCVKQKTESQEAKEHVDKSLEDLKQGEVYDFKTLDDVQLRHCVEKNVLGNFVVNDDFIKKELRKELGIKRIILWEKTIEEIQKENKELLPLHIKMIFSTRLQISLIIKIFNIKRREILEYQEEVSEEEN